MYNRVKTSITLLVVILGGAFAQLANSEEVLFTVLSRADGVRAEVGYSLKDLDALPQVTVTTGNEFIDGIADFSGPLARVVLKQTGDANAQQVDLIAANEYTIRVPVSDFQDYNVILATRQDGELFSRRDKGPIWLIYPMADHAELRDSSYNARLIWQLVRMEVLEN